jgi:hypothetical protein
MVLRRVSGATFPALTIDRGQVHRACRVIVLQSQLSLRIRPRTGTEIGHVVGSYDLGRPAGAPFGAAWLVRQWLSD